MTHLSLFSGIGGIDLAAEWAGFRTVAFVEHSKFCQRVLAKHWPGVPIHDDIKSFDAKPFRGVDLVSGGFPCQPHSLAGMRKASGDERDLWAEMRRVICEARPGWVLAENVPGLLSSESGRFFARVVDDLVQMGYRVGWGVYGASDVGAIHRRKRVFIIARNSDGERCQELDNREPAWTRDSDCGPAAHSDIADRERRLERSDDERRKDRQSLAKLLSASDTSSIEDQWVCVSELQPDARAEIASHTSGCGLPRESCGRTGEKSAHRYIQLQSGDWRTWTTKPVIRGGNDGIPNRVDRLRSLGNAVVPQQAYPILAAIAEEATP